MNNEWLNPLIRTNHFKSSYIEGFIDISGGDLNIRNSGNIYADGAVYENGVSLINKYATITNPYFDGHIIFDGDVSMNYNLDISGNLYIKEAATATQFINLSDYRIKTNITPMSETNYNIEQLKPIFYNNTLLNKPDIGFIAHEVQEHFPFLVNGNKDGDEYQSVNYIGIIGLLVNELQKIKTIINEQNISINILETNKKL